MIGKTILHYRIIKELGRGGMGVVYLAEDTKLKRQVAIKFLPHHVTGNAEQRQRFEIEAQAAAALNHPNIATIHAIEEVDDDIFIVMEYIEGQEIKSLVRVQGNASLPVRKSLNIAIQIARGLQAAHNKGIIHRDIKSSNIMITNDGQVKIMDFGLAKVVQGMQVTKEQSAVGTAAYMSPEQAQGEMVDHRTDIWSLGVVLYEMLTGRQPFKGGYEQAVIYSIMNEEPEPLGNLHNDIPKNLKQIVSKTLAKSPDQRYQNMEELLLDLKSITTAPAAERVQSPLSKIKLLIRMRSIYLYLGIALILVLSISGFDFWHKSDEPGVGDFSVHEQGISTNPQRLAVLPFANLRSDPQTDFLGFALTDQIIGALTYFKNILVRPSSAVRKFKDQPVDPPNAGEELNVDYVLTGNYLKEGDFIRLNIELVDVNSNTIIWREPIETSYENAFRLQDMVAKKVLAGLKVQFSPEERDRIQTNVPDDPLAYDYYLRSIAYPLSLEGSRLAIEMLKKSIQLDSTYAPAFSELGRRINLTAHYEMGGTGKIHDAKTAYLKALSINEELPSALSNLASLYVEIGQMEQAVELLRRLLNINPNHAEGHFSLSYAYRYAGMLKESKIEGEKALSVDPNNRRFRSMVLVYMYLGQLDSALQKSDIDPGSPWTLSWKGYLHLRLGQTEQAIVYLNEAVDLEPKGVLGFWATALESSIRGVPEKGIKALRRWEKTGIVDGEQLYFLASTYGMLGDNAACIEALHESVTAGFINYPFMLRDRYLDPIRNTPEFQQILDTAKKKHLAFKQRFFE